jgi:hypothetical protein
VKNRRPDGIPLRMQWQLLYQLSADWGHVVIPAAIILMSWSIDKPFVRVFCEMTVPRRYSPSYSPLPTMACRTVGSTGAHTHARAHGNNDVSRCLGLRATIAQWPPQTCTPSHGCRAPNSRATWRLVFSSGCRDCGGLPRFAIDCTASISLSRAELRVGAASDERDMSAVAPAVKTPVIVTNRVLLQRRQE